MEDIDFKIPMTRDKLVELGQYLPLTGQLPLHYLLKWYFIVSIYYISLMEVTLTLREFPLHCIWQNHRFQHLIVSHCILRHQRSIVWSVLAEEVKSVITVFAGADLWDRVTKPLKTALDTAAMSMEMIDQVRYDGFNELEIENKTKARRQEKRSQNYH